MTNRTVLLIIGAFLALTIGSFAWLVATWDASVEEPVSYLLAPTSPAGGIPT